MMPAPASNDTVPARPKPAAHPQPDSSSFKIVVAQSAEQLLPHVDAWDDLARQAIEPNVFFESWFLLPAVRAFGADQSLRFVFIYGEDDKKPGTPKLTGFFPLDVTRGFKGLPVQVLSLWHHPYSVLGAPLLRREPASASLEAFLDWAASNPDSVGLVHLPLCPGEGPLNHVLVERCRTQARLSYVSEAHSRALFLPREDTAAYRAAALSGHHNREMRRQERCLAKLGRVEYRVLEQADDVPIWTREFERLEAGGWKGKLGTAFACRGADQLFLRTILADGFARGQLMMLGLFIDERPIALKCNLRAGDGAFAFKIAYDESLAKHSPGVLLELFNVDYLHQHRETRWMDSCAVAGHPMIDRLWLDRRVIQNTLLSTGRRPGDAVVSLLPALRWLKRTLRIRKPKGNAP